MVKRPKVRRFFEDRDFPVSVFGPVEWAAFALLAACCASEMDMPIGSFYAWRVARRCAECGEDFW
jgi:hypothetical protein